MSLLFVSAFIAGLALAVYAMIRGVERPARGESTVPVDAFGRALASARTSLRAPTLAAFAAPFGAVGYLLSHYSSLGTVPVLVAAAAAGGLGTMGAVLLILKGVVPAARNDVVDERFLLMGHLAQVSARIGATAGEITYEIDGTRYAAVARSVDGTSVDVGTDVVIERVEDGIAFVEPWVQVEQRL